MEFMVEDSKGGEGRAGGERAALLANLRLRRGRGEGLLEGLDLRLVADHRLHHTSPHVDFAVELDCGV
jgi:hypothetical protein